jgi:hypothetical protein
MCARTQNDFSSASNAFKQAGFNELWRFFVPGINNKVKTFFLPYFWGVGENVFRFL